MNDSGYLCVRRGLLCAVLVIIAAATAWAEPTATVTTLSISSSNVSVGTPVTVSARVSAGGSPVAVGLVLFCDAAAPHCTDAALLGSVWVSKAGTANIQRSFGTGVHNIQAVFQGTSVLASSTSSVQNVTVTGAPLLTATALNTSGAAGNYTLSGTVTASGPVAPTGTVSFLDGSNGNYSLASATLGSSVAWFPGFQTVTAPSMTGQGWSAIASGDFNNDGFPDFVIASANDPYLVAVMLGKGDGTFTLGSDNFPGTYASIQSLAVADLNGDGNLDIVALSANGYTSAVLLGNGDGTFTVGATLPISYATAVAIADFNGDGIPDLAVANSADGGCQVTILLGKGDGSFTTGITQPLPACTTAITGLVAADLSGDGTVDLAVPSPNSISVVSILKGNGDGTFTVGATYNVGVLATAAATGDFNGDGISDLVIANSGSNTLTLLLGNGDGTFTQAGELATGTTPVAVVAGDFNSDGKTDIAVVNSGSSNISVFYGNGNGTFAASTKSPNTGSAPSAISVSDFNGDGMADVITANRNTTLAATILLQTLTSSTAAIATNVNVVGNAGGSHNVAASYGGDANFLNSISSAVALTSSPAKTTTSLTVSPSTSVPTGGSSSVTVTISPSSAGNYSPSGVITLYDGASAIAYTYPSSGVGTFGSNTLNALALGSHSLSATFAGDSYFNSSSSPIVPVTVMPGAPAMTCTPQSSSLTYGSTGPMINVLVYGNSSSLPTGTVGMYVDSNPTPLETDTLAFYSAGTSYVNAGGKYWTKISAGIHTFTMKYSGDSNWAASSCSSVISVAQDTPQMVLTVSTSKTPSTAGSAVTFSIRYRDPLNCRTLCTAPTGSITFYSDGVSIGSSALNLSLWSSSYFSGSISTSSLPVGTHTITASYSGDANYATLAPGGAITQTVTSATTAPTINSWPTASPINYGQSLSSSTLTGGSASTPGTFTFTNPNTTPPVGTAAQSVTFTPTDLTSYTTVTGTVNVTVTKATPTINAWPTASAISYGQTLASSTLSGGNASVIGTFTFAAPTTAPAVGTAAQNVIFTPNDTTDYNTVNGTVNVTVNLTPQSITVTTPAPGTAAFGTQFTVAATASSGLTVAYSASGGCTNSGATFTMTSGTTACVVTYSQSGEGNYAPAANVTSTTTAALATQAALTVAGVPGTAQAYGATFTVGTSGGSGTGAVTFAATGACSVSGATVTITSGTGTCSVTATKAADGNYAVSSSAPSTVSATPASQLITVTSAAPASAQYATQFTVAAIASSGLTVNYVASGGCTNSGATFTMTSGTTPCTVTYSQGGNTNYAAAANVSSATSATLAPQTTLSVTGVPGTAQPFGATFTVGSSGGNGTGAVTFAATGACSVTGTTVTMTSGSGTCSVTATKASDGNYAIATSAAATVNAGLASQSITVTTPAPASAPYGTQFTVAATASSGLAVTYSASGGCTSSGATFTMTSGTTACTVTYLQAGNASYGPATNVTSTTTAALATQATLSVTGVPATAQAYGATFTVGTSGGSGAGAVTFTTTGSCTVTGSTVKMTSGTGTCSVTATKSADNNYSSATSSTASVSATRAATTTVLASSSNPSNYGVSVTFTATVSPVAPATGAPTGNVTFYDAGVSIGTATLNGSGVATLSTSSLSAGTHSITASYLDDAKFAPSASGTVSQVVNALKLVFTTQPGGGTAGTVWTQQPVVKVEDVNGNVITGSTASITLTIANNPGGGSLTCTSDPLSAISGVATFSGCSIQRAGTAYTLSATSPGLTSATSSAFNITAATANKLVWVVNPPANVTRGAIIPNMTVWVEDQYGNTITNSTASITLALMNAQGNDSATGTLTVNAVAGVATFSGIKITGNQSRSGAYFNASSTGFTTVASTTFNIN